MPSKLLVPLDGSVLGEVAVSWAAYLARTAEHSIVLAQAVPWPPVAADGLMAEYVPADVYDDTMNAEHEAATAYLAGVRDRLTSQGLHAEIVVREGSPCTALLDLADELSGDAIVMATHGCGGATLRLPRERRQRRRATGHDPGPAGPG